MNPSRLAIMSGVIDSTKQSGARDDQIAVLTQYKGQLMMIRNLGLRKETTATVASTWVSAQSSFLAAQNSVNPFFL